MKSYQDIQERVEERVRYKMQAGNASDPFEWSKVLSYLQFSFLGICILLILLLPNCLLTVIAEGFLLGDATILLFRYLIIKGIDNLYYPDRADYEPKPIFGPAYQARAQQRYGDALALLLETTRKFPNQAQSYVLLMEIYARDFHDWEQVEIIYQWGLNTLTDKQELQTLNTAHTLYTQSPASHSNQTATTTLSGENIPS